jgi:hypothetical protein
MRENGKHTVIDGVDEAKAFFSELAGGGGSRRPAKTANRLIFLSHQWTGFGVPDPDGVQFPVMVSGIKHAAAVNGWSIDTLWVWADYSYAVLRCMVIMRCCAVGCAHHSNKREPHTSLLQVHSAEA